MISNKNCFRSETKQFRKPGTAAPYKINLKKLKLKKKHFLPKKGTILSIVCVLIHSLSTFSSVFLFTSLSALLYWVL